MAAKKKTSKKTLTQYTKELKDVYKMPTPKKKKRGKK